MLRRVTSLLSTNPEARGLLLAALVTMLALVIYLPFQSKSLDDADSFNFARALVDLNPAAGNPHSPGYVLYVWLGRIALAMTGDARVALTSLSAISAALACGLLFAMASELFNERVGLYAFALVLFTPLMWLNANKALSDAPGLVVQALCMLFIVLAVRRRAPLWVAGVCLGVAAGFRPQGVLGLAGAAVLAAIWLRLAPREWLATGLAVGISVLSWLVPLLAAFGWRVDALRAYLGGAAGFVISQDSLFVTAVSLESILARGQVLWFWSSQAVFGPLAGWQRSVLFAGTLLLTASACVGKRRDIAVWLCLAWLVPQVAVHLFFLNPSFTRYLIVFLFPVAMLVAVGLDVLFRRRIAMAVVLVFMAVVGLASLPLAQGLHTILSPPEQLADYVAQRYAPGNTMIIARQSYNALLYYLPGWRILFADYFGDVALQQEIARANPTYVVIADPGSLRPSEEYVEIETRSFARDPQIHAKHAQVELDIYGRAADLTPRDFALPEDNTILIGTPQDAKYLLQGWYWREDIGGVTARWTGSDTTTSLRVLLPQQAMMLTLRAVSFPANQAVEFLCNDQLFANAPVPQDWAEISVVLPASCVQPDQLTRITFRASVLGVPASDGSSTDRRSLSIAVAEIRFSP